MDSYFLLFPAPTPEITIYGLCYGKAYFMQIDVQSTQTDRSMSRFLANVYNCNVSTKDYILLDISFGAIIIAPPWRGERQNN